MRLFHRTTESAATSILADGFRDATGTYGTGEEFAGVWLSNVPLNVNQGANGNALLVVDLPEEKITDFEWVEDEKPYREFLVPAAIVNTGSVRAATNEDEV